MSRSDKPDLIAAARRAMYRLAESDLLDDRVRFFALRDALAALPPDPRIVPAALLEEAAQVVTEMDDSLVGEFGGHPHYKDLAARLKAYVDQEGDKA